MARSETKIPSGELLEIESILDQATEGLLNINVETLLRIASVYNNEHMVREDKAESLQLSLSDALRVRLSWKLLLFERVLRQTRVNLNGLGLGQERLT